MSSGAAVDGQRLGIRFDGQDWIVPWHPPYQAPDGTPHGAIGACVTSAGEVVLISSDGERWGFPAGCPEPGENWEQTLRREALEQACATVAEAALLGFNRGARIAGPERGLVLLVQSAHPAHPPRSLHHLRPMKAISGRPDLKRPERVR